MITTNVPILKIHKLAQAQYDRELANGNIDENALYLTPDEGNSAGSYIIPINGDLEFDSSFSFSWEELLTAIDNKYYVAIRQNSEDFYGREFILSRDLRDEGEIEFTHSNYKIIYTLTLSGTGFM